MKDRPDPSTLIFSLMVALGGCSWRLSVVCIACHLIFVLLLSDALHTTDYVHVPQVIKSFSPGGQYVLLTFSNGPHHLITGQILDILDAFKAKASFFVYGQRSLHFPDIVRRIVQDGHDIGHQGYHTISHLPSSMVFSKLTEKSAQQSIMRASHVLQNITGRSVEFFRAPFGEIAADLEKNTIMKECKLSSVHWSLDSKDSFAVDSSGILNSKSVVDQVLSRVSVGDVILFHDTQPVLLEALPIILQRLQLDGYEFLTLSDILRFPDDKPH